MQHDKAKKILLIEDSATWRTLIAALFPDWRLTIAPDFNTAIDCLQARDDFDCIITDLILPDSPPEETVDRLRQLWDGPLVVLTSAPESSNHSTVVVDKSLIQEGRVLRLAVSAAVEENNVSKMFARMKPRGLYAGALQIAIAACLR